MTPPRPSRSRFILLLSGVLLGACVTPLQRPGFSGGPLALDTESVGRMRSAASLKGAVGLATSSAVRTAASQIALLVPAVLALFPNNEAGNRSPTQAASAS